MFATDSFFRPASTVFRQPMLSLRTPFQRKGSEASLITPLSSRPSSPTSSSSPLGAVNGDAEGSDRLARRRLSDPIVLARARPRTAGASIVAALLLLAWFCLSAGPAQTTGHLSQIVPSSHARPSKHASSRSRSSSHASHSLASIVDAPLTQSQELAALTLFLTSEATHMLPEELNPDLPLDPDLVLDMALSTNPVEREDDLQAMEAETWGMTPVVILGKRGDSSTKLAHELLHGEDYFGKDGAGIATVYVDRRSDTPVLTGLLARLTHRSSLPVILVGGVPLGGYKELLVQHNEGHLLGLMERQGCVLGRDAIKRRMKERQRELTGRQQNHH